MKIPGPDIAWFLALSMAAHAGLLLVDRPAAPEIGHAGHVVRLSVTERAGSRRAAPATPAQAADIPASPAASAPATAPAQDRTASTGKTRAATPPAQRIATAGKSAAPTAASSTPLAGSQSPSPRESENHLRRSVLDLFSQRLNYPAIARRKGWQGTVTLRLLIEPDGRISRLHVDRTSGYPVLDRAAIESLQLASVPQAGYWLHGRTLELLVPVEYRLVGS